MIDESWIEDYIQPAIEQKKVENFKEMLEKSRLPVEKKTAQKKKNVAKKLEKDPDETETETEESGDEYDANVKASKGSGPTSKVQAVKKVARKAKSTKSKTKFKENNSDLIAAIRNKNGRGNPLASIAAKYGVSSIEEDPLDDAEFAKLKSKYKKK